MAALATPPFVRSRAHFDIAYPDTSLPMQTNLNGLAREALDGASDTDMADGGFDTIQPENEKEDVAILDLDQAETDIETRKILRADDCEPTQCSKLVDALS